MRIDAHQHFWKYDPVKDSWITDEMNVLQNDFLPNQLETLLGESKIDGSVLIQSDQTIEGNNFLINLGRESPFIKGVVGWVDLCSETAEDEISKYLETPVVKGFRHILQSEANRSFMLEPAFLRGVKLLGKYDFTYDILIFKDQLKYVPEFLKHFPNQKFVLDHLAKPDIKNHLIGEWEKGLRKLAAFDNLYCKVSGMFAEADWHHWEPVDFTPYLDIAMEVFGVDRLMYGSDWPVCLVATSYKEQFEVVKRYFSSLTPNEQNGVLGENAIRFYRLQ